MNRLEQTVVFYQRLHELERHTGGTRTLAECHGRMDRPKRGVYLFSEPVELRSH